MTISDFDPTEDSIVVQALVPADVSVTGQAVTDGNLVITLSTGATVTLTGVDAEIDADTIAILSPTA